MFIAVEKGRLLFMFPVVERQREISCQELVKGGLLGILIGTIFSYHVLMILNIIYKKSMGAKLSRPRIGGLDSFFTNEEWKEELCKLRRSQLKFG